MVKYFLKFHHFGTSLKSVFSRFHKCDIKMSQIMNVFNFCVNISNKQGIVYINWPTNSLEFEKKCLHDLDEFSKKKCQVQIWSNRWGCVTLLWKFIIHAKISLSQHSRTTFKPDLTCKLLPVRAIYYFPTWGGWPCR